MYAEQIPKYSNHCWHGVVIEYMTNRVIIIGSFGCGRDCDHAMFSINTR
jgi:hypothetical protein